MQKNAASAVFPAAEASIDRKAHRRPVRSETR